MRLFSTYIRHLLLLGGKPAAECYAALAPSFSRNHARTASRR